jgi:uncharacterized protein (DUF885 family)
VIGGRGGRGVAIRLRFGANPRVMRTAWLVAFALVGCAGASVPPAPPQSTMPPPPAAPPPAAPLAWTPPDAASGVHSPELRALLGEHWAWTMSESPVWATRLGIHRFDDRLGDRSLSAIHARRENTREFLARAEEIDAQKLDSGDATTLRLFMEDAKAEISTFVCEYELWSLSPRDNPVTEWNELREVHAVETVQDGRNLVARYRQIPGVIDADIANLREGLGRGLSANAESTRRVLDMVEKQLAQPLDAWPMLEPAKKAHDAWPPAELARFRSELRAAVEKGVMPALGRYRHLVKEEILAKARGADAEGISALPRGADCYAAEIRRHTTLDRSADELFALGEREIARIDAEMLALGRKLFGAKTFADVIAKLARDPKLRFDSDEEIVRAAENALARAKAAIPKWFGILPKADCVVRRIPDYEAPYTTVAYYKLPNPDGSKPGEYFVNVYQPKTRLRFEAEVLAYHESIPGHHLQIAIAQELGDLPAFRKNGLTTAFVEGWGLYAEQLAKEMGLYSDELQLMGLLSFDAWRASRLVVDTGIHAKGWTRAQAEKYMLEHTALSRENVQNEVDRYITWPGQALAYKVGELEMLAERKRAEAELGARFSLPKFHDAVLEHGSVSLPELRRQIDAFIREGQGKS